ncbi:MAG: hypothetical protein O2942_09230 [Proteobacteria bacterium]|nr:hypothetical protein [Pseudomonadota bacterium]
MPFPRIDNDMLNIGAIAGDIPVIGAGNKLPNFLIDAGVGANKFLQLDGSARLPAIDASLLTNLPGSIGGSGSLHLIETQIANNSVNVDFTTGIGPTYEAHLIRVINAEPLASGSLRLQVSTSGGASYRGDGNYHWSNAELRGGNSPSWNMQGNLSSASLDVSVRTLATGEVVSVDILLYRPFFTGNKKVFLWEGASIDSGYNRIIGGGHYNGTTSPINALRFFFSSGDIASGTFKLYGIS